MEGIDPKQVRRSGELYCLSDVVKGLNSGKKTIIKKRGEYYVNEHTARKLMNAPTTLSGNQYLQLETIELEKMRIKLEMEQVKLEVVKQESQLKMHQMDADVQIKQMNHQLEMSKLEIQMAEMGIVEIDIEDGDEMMLQGLTLGMLPIPEESDEDDDDDEPMQRETWMETYGDEDDVELLDVTPKPKKKRRGRKGGKK